MFSEMCKQTAPQCPRIFLDLRMQENLLCTNANTPFVEPENGIDCEICGSFVGPDFIYCPFCGQRVNFISSGTGRIPIPVGVIILAAIQIMFSMITLGEGVLYFSFYEIGISLLNIIFGILLFNGYWLARYVAIPAAFLLSILFFSIQIDILVFVILILYLTRPGVVAYFEQGPRKLA